MRKSFKLFVAFILAISLLFTISISAAAVAPELTDNEEDLVIPGYNPDPIAPCTLIPGSDLLNVPSPNIYPYKAIAFLTVSFDDCTCLQNGTGFMVSANCMMTAAHVLTCLNHDNIASEVYARFGYSHSSGTHVIATTATSDNAVFYTSPDFEWTVTIVDNKPVYGVSVDDDWGYVAFDQNIGNTTGWFGIRVYNNNSALLELSVVACGYDRTQFMKWGGGTVRGITPKTLAYTASTQPGMSGGAVYRWYEEGEVDVEGYYAVAINSAHSDEYVRNYGVRFTSAIVNHLRTAGYVE